MKKLLTCETTVLSLFFSLVLAVLTLSWQAHPQANPHQQNFEKQLHDIFGMNLERMFRQAMRDIEVFLRRCRKENPRASNCGPVVKHLEVPSYGFSLALEEDRLVFRGSYDEWNIPIEDCSKHLIENFFWRITALVGEHSVHEIGSDAIEVHANGLIFGVTLGSGFFTFIENLPHEFSSLEDRITRGCQEG